MIEKIKCVFDDKEIKQFGRCTVCKMTAHIEVPFLNASILNWVKKHPTVKANVNMFRLNMTTTAKAMQSTNDEPDESIGKRLAESRAKRQIYQFCYTLYQQLYKCMGMRATQYRDTRDSFSKYISKEKEHQHDIVYGE